MKHTLKYWSKLLQFRYETLRNKWEIRKAYGGMRPVILPRKVVVTALAALAVAIVFGAGWMGVNALIRMAGLHAIDVRTVPLPKQSPTVPGDSGVAPTDTTVAGIIVSTPAPAVVSEPPPAKQLVAFEDIPAKQIPPGPVGDLMKKMMHFSSEMKYILLANKASKTIYLLTNSEGTWQIAETFRMAIGEKSGQKKSAGDKRTPEGLYFIIGRKEKYELSVIYGPLSYVLNYPNDEDVKDGRTGQGIWIHGTNPDSSPVSTKGCLELDNSNLLKLSGYLGVGIGTPVQIINKNEQIDPVQEVDFAALSTRRKRILDQCSNEEMPFVEFLSDWKTAWESRDIGRYGSMYAVSDFSGQGLRWSQWSEKKQRTFEAYADISIDIDKIALVNFSESTAVVAFVQRYSSSHRSPIENGKKLSLIKQNGKWKIYREDTFPKEELVL